MAGLDLSVQDLPKAQNTGEAALRLRRELELSGKELRPEQFEEDDPLRLYLEEVAAIPACGDEQLLGDLNERQRRVLRLRFGMEDGVCYSLEQVGQLLGVSKERARQIERQAMDKLQQLGTGMGLEDFLE